MSLEHSGQSELEANALQSFAVEGYKSIRNRQEIEIAPLTILAGANSSGKSALIQPLLLLKQTLEAGFDPGGLRINGPLVKFTEAAQVFSRNGERVDEKKFSIRLTVPNNRWVEPEFGQTKTGLDVFHQEFPYGDQSVRLGYPETDSSELEKLNFSLKQLEAGLESSLQILDNEKKMRATCNILKERGFLQVEYEAYGFHSPYRDPDMQGFKSNLLNCIYLGGWRGMPERTYPVSSTGPFFPGRFENYTASILAEGGSGEGKSNLAGISEDLKRLGLTRKVETKQVNDVAVEVLVDRMPPNSDAQSSDLVNIADVGIGVSQVLPILTALRVAKPGQLVIIEQPELHLHPRAQTGLAEIFFKAAEKGVRVIVETHSRLLLLGIQTQVANNSGDRRSVKLYWVTRDENGCSHVKPGELDEFGRYGDWPEDFDEVALETEAAFIKAVHEQRSKKL